MREALQEYGVCCELIVIPDGDKAIHFIEDVEAQRHPRPHLAIVDLNLPKRPGHEVLAHMRESEVCRGTIVVVLSSSNAPRDRAKALELGAAEYIRKPMRLQEFLDLGARFKSLLESSMRRMEG